MRVFEEKQWFNQLWLHLIVTLPVFGALAYICLQWYVYENPVDKVGPNDYAEQLLVISLLLLTALLIFVFRLRTVIDEKGVQYQFVPFHKRSKLVTWKELESVRVRQYKPLSEYGGWGYRAGLGGGAYNVKGNQGIQLVFKNGKKLLIGTQKPNEAQLVIDKYFKNEGI